MKKICSLVFALVASGLAQNGNAAHVLVPLLAHDSHHHLVTDLTSATITVSERKTPVANVSIVRGSDLPLELGFAIDTSRSVQDESHIGELIEAARSFANNTLIRPDDRVFFSTFSTEAEATGWLSKEQLARVVIKVKKGQGTALYDSVAAACRERMGPRDWSHPTRRVLIVISDGDDNTSHITRDQAISQVLGSGVVMFTIATQQSGMIQRGQRILAYWAEQSGGESFTSLTRVDAPKAFETIRQAIGGLYYISYAPPTSADKIHEVEIKPASKGKLELSYPRKYFWDQ
jgi:VWFA-related protein